MAQPITDQEIVDTQMANWHDFLRSCRRMGLWFVALEKSETGFTPFQISTTRQNDIAVRELDLRSIIL